MSDTPSKPIQLWVQWTQIRNQDSTCIVTEYNPNRRDAIRMSEHSALVAAQAEIERLTLLFKNCDVGAVAGLHLEIERLKTEAKENVEYQTNHANAFKYSFDAKKRQCDELKAELERTQKEMSHRDSIHRIDILEHVRKIQSLEDELERAKEEAKNWEADFYDRSAAFAKEEYEHEKLKVELERVKAPQECAVWLCEGGIFECMRTDLERQITKLVIEAGESELRYLALAKMAENYRSKLLSCAEYFEAVKRGEYHSIHTFELVLLNSIRAALEQGEKE